MTYRLAVDSSRKIRTTYATRHVKSRDVIRDFVSNIVPLIEHPKLTSFMEDRGSLDPQEARVIGTASKMSFFGKLIGDFIRTATNTQPYAVEDIKLEQYLRHEVILYEDHLKLLNVKGRFECLLYPPGQTEGVGYSLFRVDALAEAETAFRLLSPRLNTLVKADQKLAYKLTLQKLCDTLREHPTWTCAHVAAYLGHHDCFRHPEIIPQLSQQDSAMLITPLHLAVQSNNLRTVTELLMMGARVNITDAQGNTVMHMAADTTPEMIQYLSGKDRALLSQLNSFGESPVHLACRQGRPDTLDALLRWGADPRLSQGDMYPIHCAVKRDDVPCVDTLVRLCPESLGLQDAKYGATPMHWARSKEMSTLLLTSGCDRYALNRFGDTPLHVLTMKNRPDCVVTMLTYDTDPNTEGRNGNYPLHLAIQSDNLDLIRAFIVFGANVDALNDNKETARHLLDRSRGPNREVILHTLHAVGASRCSKGMSGCLDGCRYGGSNNGKAPPLSVLPVDVRNQLYDDLLGAAIINSALASKSGQQNSLMDMVDSPTDRNLNVLSLDGGGIRGLVLIQILLELERVLGRPVKDCFDWIAGTSTGGILALAITYGKTMRYTQGLYFRLKDEVFRGKRPYDSEPLEGFMKREFGEHTRMTEVLHPRVMVSAVLGDRHPAELHFFTNYERPLVEHDDNIQNQCQRHLQKPLQPTAKPKEQLVWRAGRCSGAAPTYFRACGRFLDGGLIANNPCLDLLTEIHEYNTMVAAKGKPELVRRVSCVVSLGTGKIPLEQVGAVDVFRPEGVLELWKTALGAQNLATLLVDQATDSEGRSVDRSRAWCGMAMIPFFRFSPPLSEDVPLDAKDNTTLLKMLWETKAYLYSNRGRMEQLATLLKP